MQFWNSQASPHKAVFSGSSGKGVQYHSPAVKVKKSNFAVAFRLARLEGGPIILLFNDISPSSSICVFHHMLWKASWHI